MFECRLAELFYSLYLHQLKSGGILPIKTLKYSSSKLRETVSQNFPAPKEGGEGQII